MANALEYTCGETIVVAIGVTSGDRTQVTSAAAQLRPGRRGVRTVSEEATLTASFTVTTRDPIGDLPGGWDLTIAAADSAAIPPGPYLIDFRAVIGSSVIYSSQRSINLKPAVTRL